MARFFIILLLSIASLSFIDSAEFVREDKLSSYGFFEGRLSELRPAQRVFFYDLNSPLFSNYAEKLRFIYLPAGATMEYNDSIAFNFPTGTVLIKNFFYPSDFRKPEKGRKILETRLLVRTGEGWEAYPYIWNDEQTDAFYDPAGETREIAYVGANGKKVRSAYVIPNKNQCKGCHVRNDRIVPIGPTARQLNRVVGGENQLVGWSREGLLANLPSLEAVPSLVNWQDGSSADLNLRARSYLDANCGHCHSRTGPASTSGLFLGFYEQSLAHLGVNKAPVAAGRGSGDLRFDIVPGRPDQSILLYRMKTNDPAIAMPEIGREQVHKEGVELIEEWIRKNTFAEH